MNEINVMHKDRIYNSTHTHTSSALCGQLPAHSALGKLSLCPTPTSLCPGLSCRPCSPRSGSFCPSFLRAQPIGSRVSDTSHNLEHLSPQPQTQPMDPCICYGSELLVLYLCHGAVKYNVLSPYNAAKKSHSLILTSTLIL